MSILNSIELTNRWRSHLRKSCADSIKSRRRYAKRYGKDCMLSHYFDGKEQGTRQAIKVLEYMVEYQELFHGDS